MSRRTSEASKAIREAWEKERQLVLEGTGTRDWSPEQQQAIIDKGKAYDDDGKAFEGHHMKSAEAYPEYQGDAENIQFLTRAEHKDAHGGSFQNPTNGYYNTLEKLTKDFGENKYEPCEVIKLSEPIRSTFDSLPSAKENDKGATEKGTADTDLQEDIKKQVDSVLLHNEATRTDSKTPKTTTTSTVSKDSVRNSLARSLIKQGFTFLKNHWKEIAIRTIEAGVMYCCYKLSGGSSSDSAPYDLDDSSQFESNENDDSPVERDYPDERSSPREHDVSGYDRHQNGKLVHVKSYKRGGKNKDD